MATNVGSGAAFIRLRPDTAGFRGEAKSLLDAIRLNANVKLRPDLTGFRTALQTQISALRPFSVKVKADVSTIRSSVRAAITGLPNGSVTVHANLTGNASSRLAAIDALASKLDGRRITMDLALTGGVAVTADIAAIRAALTLLNGQTATITINLRPPGVAAALAAIGTIGQRSAGQTRMLIDAFILFGSAAVPALAAATAGAVSLGGAIASVVAGAGVGILALSGIVGAVKALGKAQSDRAKASALNAREDRQTANNADAVRSALAGVTSAERGYASAQRDALRAQLEINEAREDAKRDLEDLDSAIKNNNLSLRRGQMDLERAKAELDRVLTDPSATKRQRAEAQLTYDEATQQLDDLGLRQRRLAQEQDAAARAGVDGSKKVIAAQERARDAQERVAEAAEGVAAAYRAVQSAQRAAATSAITSASTAGAALDDLEAKLANLSPAGREFAKFLFGLKEPLLDLRREAETGFLPAMQSGLTGLVVFLPKVKGFVRTVAEELGSLGERASRALSGDRFREFFGVLNDTSTHTLEQFGRSIGNIAEGLGHVVVAFLPVQRQVTGGLVDMTERFARFSEGLRTNRGFQDFIAYVQTRGPVVLSTIGDVAGALLHVAEAAAPIGDVVLGILRAFSATIGAIPTPVLTTLLGVFIALRGAALLAAIPVGAIGARLATLPGQIIAMTTSMAAFRVGMASFAAALGGPVVLGLTAVATVVGLVAANSGKAKERAESARSAFQSFGDSLKDGITPAALENAQSLLRNNKQLAELAELTSKAGVDVETLVRGLNGEADARATVLTVINKQIEAARQAEQDAKRYNARLDRYEDTRESEQLHKRVVALEGMAHAFDVTSHAEARAASITGAWVEQQRTASSAAADLKPKIAALQGIYDVLTSATATATERASAFRRAIEAYTDPMIGAIEAEEKQIQTLDALGEALAENGTEFDLSRAKNEGHRKQILASRDALEAALLAAREKTLADIAAKVPLEEAAAANKRRIEEILKEIPASQRNTAEVQNLVKAYGEIPSEVVTAMKTTGAAAVLEQLKNLKIAQLALEKNISIQDAQASVNAAGKSTRIFAATGGFIRGPGGPRDDAIDARLSAGEYVVNAEATRWHLPLLEKINGGTHMYANGGLVEPKPLRLAKGGSVTAPFPVDTSKTFLPDPMTRLLASGWVPGGTMVNDVASTAYAVAKALGANFRVMLSLFMAGLVESGMKNLNYGDRDSLGFLQQRPSQGWPNPMDVPTATRSFVLRAMPAEKLHPNWTPGQVAQWVQRSAFPLRYDQRRAEAEALLASIISGAGRIGGQGGGSLGGSAGMMRILRAVFPGLPLWSGYRPGSRTLSGSLSYHASDRAVDVPPRRDVAAWIRTNYGTGTRELITPFQDLNLHNGRPHTYTGAVWNQHNFAGGNAHDHWAYARGGLVSYDQGGDLLPGVTPAYNGTGGTEYVATTKTDMSNVALSDDSINQLAAAILSPYNLGRLAQAMSTRPVNVMVDGQLLASTVSDKMAGSLAVAGIEVR